MLEEFTPTRITERRRTTQIGRVRALEGRVHTLERRIQTLEAKMKQVQSGAGAAETLMREFPMGLNKSDAAEWLKVSRATVYAMIRDGRLEVNDAGKVTAESIAKLMDPRHMAEPER